MSPLLHPYLAVLWAALTLALGVLLYLLRRERNLFGCYVWWCLVQNLLHWWAVYNTKYWSLFYASWWGLEFAEYAAAFALILWYAFGCLRSRKRLPESFPGVAALVALTLTGTVLLIGHYAADPDASPLLAADQMAQIVLCLVAWCVGVLLH